MKKRSNLFGLILLLIGFAVPAYAENLLGVYHDAVLQDPTYRQARADWMSAKENFPIAVSAYLPQVDVTGSFKRNYVDTHPTATADGFHNSYGYTVTLTQPIFNFQTWKDISGTAASVKAATATYFSASQDLMARTASAYFAVLQAYDQLRYTLANKRAVHRQLVTAQQQFKVGLIAVTGVYNAQSTYDQTLADEIADRNDLYNALENLRAITGAHYEQLVGIKKQVPLIALNPTSIDAWVSVAERQNYSLKAQGFSVIAARENIKEQAAARLPVINAVGSQGETKSRKYSANVSNGSAQNWNIGLALDFKPIQGGGVFAKTAKARFDYLSAVSKREFAHRDIVNQTRQAYLGVMSGASQIRADKQAIASAKKAVEATEAGYQAGTRTMVDVLRDLTTLYQARQKYASDQYTYLNDIIKLKEAAGTLCYRDLQKINSWLTGDRALPLPDNLYRQDHFKSLAPKFKTKSLKPAKAASKKRTVKSKRHQKHKQHVAMKPRYALQVFASTHRGGAQHFVAAHDHITALRVVKVNRFYKVVYGRYSTRQEATAARKGLPQVLKRYHPWVVKVRR